MNKLKHNLSIVFISILVSCWFKGFTIIFDHFVPSEKRTLTTGIIICGIVAFFLWLDDGSLSEINRGKKFIPAMERNKQST